MRERFDPLWLAGIVVIAAVSTWLACSSGPPFNSYDPPPTFALYYTLTNQSDLYYPAAYGNGSSLSGSYTGVDIVGGPFVTAGTTKSFPDTWVTFGSYYTVNGGRWPADWVIKSDAGACVGQSTRLAIESKLPEVTCYIDPGTLEVQPNSWGTVTPSSLLLTFNKSQVPVGTAAQTYIVQEVGNTGYALQEEDITTNSSDQASIDAPDLPNGTFYVVADFEGLPQSYAAQAKITRSCPDGECP